MAAPIVPALARTASGVAVGTVAGSVVSMTISPFMRGCQYGANRERPNLVPEVPDIVGAWYGGWIQDDALFAYLMRTHGIVVDNRSTDEYHRGWGNIIGYKKPELPFDVTLSAWHEGLVDDAYLELVLSKQSLADDHHINTVKGSLPAYTTEFIYRQHYLGFHGPDWGPREMRRTGFAQGERWKSVLQENRQLDITLALPLAQRGHIDQAELIRNVSANGYPDESTNAAIRKMAFEIPGASDLIRFAVREGWDERVVQAFGYDDEFPERFEFWMRKQGFTYKPADVFPDYGFGDELTWPKLYWRAHWDVMSPTMSYEAFHRLRGDPADPASWRVPGTKPFTLQSLETILKIADYPRPMRDWLVAISHRVIGRIDLRRIYATGVFGQPRGKAGVTLNPDNTLQRADRAEREVYERYRDMGYAERESAVLTAWQAADWERTTKGRATAKVKTLVCQSYSLGAIDRAEATRRLTASGVDKLDAAAVVDNCDLALSISTLRETIKAIRGRFLRGEVDEIRARIELGAAGVSVERGRDHITNWRAQKSSLSKQASASEMCQWHAEGSLTVDDMRTRLSNLGYSDDDAERVIRHCVLGIFGRSAKELAKRRAAQLRDQEKLQRLAQQRDKLATAIAGKERQKRSAAHTDRNLSVWLRAGEIGEAEVIRILRDRGMSAADVRRWLAVYGRVVDGKPIPTTPLRRGDSTGTASGESSGDGGSESTAT